MILDGQKFLLELSELPSETYEHFFAESACRLGLGAVFDRNDLRLLLEASLCAASCNYAFNSCCRCGISNGIDHEPHRSRLEYEFMAARDLFYTSPGWQNLARSKRAQLEKNFLRVSVGDEKLLW
jgi:hypothetical protein